MYLRSTELSQQASPNRLNWEKADPSKRYIIDIAFVLSDRASGLSRDWKDYIENDILKISK